jgi:hypothetical protein
MQVTESRHRVYVKSVHGSPKRSHLAFLRNAVPVSVWSGLVRSADRERWLGPEENKNKDNA